MLLGEHPPAGMMSLPLWLIYPLLFFSLFIQLSLGTEQPRKRARTEKAQAPRYVEHESSSDTDSGSLCEVDSRYVPDNIKTTKKILDLMNTEGVLSNPDLVLFTPVIDAAVKRSSLLGSPHCYINSRILESNLFASAVSVYLESGDKAEDFEKVAIKMLKILHDIHDLGLFCTFHDVLVAINFAVSSDKFIK